MTGERIKKLRKEKGLTQQQLGEMLGVQKSAIAKYENGRVPNLKKETLSRLAEIFNVTPNYLLGIDEPAYHGHSHNIDIPLYSDVCCGDGIFVEDNIEEYISLPESLLSSRKDYFCQYADGDSMIDENIQSGDLLFLKRHSNLIMVMWDVLALKIILQHVKNILMILNKIVLFYNLQMINILQLLLMNIIIMNLKSLENLPLLFLKETKIKTPFQMKRSFFINFNYFTVINSK